MESFVREIKAENDELIAVIIKSEFSQPGLKFLTPTDAILQVGYMGHPAGYSIKRHAHKPVLRNTIGTQEVLFVRRGKINVLLFSTVGEFISENILEKGDVILLLAGGHQIELLEDSELFEVKNGPYAQTEDKTLF